MAESSTGAVPKGGGGGAASGYHGPPQQQGAQHRGPPPLRNVVDINQVSHLSNYMLYMFTCCTITFYDYYVSVSRSLSFRFSQMKALAFLRVCSFRLIF